MVLVLSSSLRFTRIMVFATIFLLLTTVLRRPQTHSLLVFTQAHQGTSQFSISSLGRETNGAEAKMLETTSLKFEEEPRKAIRRTLLGGRKTMINLKNQEKMANEKIPRRLMSATSGESKQVSNQKNPVNKRSSSAATAVLPNKAYLEKSDQQASETNLFCSSSKCAHKLVPSAGKHHDQESSDQQKIMEKEVMSLMQKDYHDFWSHGGPRRRPPIHNSRPKD